MPLWFDFNVFRNGLAAPTPKRFPQPIHEMVFHPGSYLIRTAVWFSSRWIA